jgi:crotonobetainyl-CoA:carnitine CoA-transferase CaiB-like acyl-CoA transferase
MAKIGWTPAAALDAAMKPLHGVRMLELARILAGPWCGQLLADLGAEVIKIERPGSGDDTRHWGPPFVMSEQGENLGAAYYHSANRGKRSVAVDISTPVGQDIVRGLACDADILIENYKVGGLAKFGLDHAALALLNPRLITCSITGFGQNGPYAHRAGYDYIAQAMGGLMSRLASRNANHRKPVLPLPTFSPASTARWRCWRRSTGETKPGPEPTSTWPCLIPR